MFGISGLRGDNPSIFAGRLKKPNWLHSDAERPKLKIRQPVENLSLKIYDLKII
ncbi:MAG: hypothetical protein WAX69_17005 [Victivallales bacterium]